MQWERWDRRSGSRWTPARRRYGGSGRRDKAWLGEIREGVRGERLVGDRLRLHPHKAHVSRIRDGLDLLGYLVYPDSRLLRNDNGHRFARRLRRFAREYGADRMGWTDFDAAVQSWIGHARHADTEGLRRRIFSATIFTRGVGREAPGA
jgi:RNA-directed DNA polymerase